MTWKSIITVVLIAGFLVAVNPLMAAEPVAEPSRSRCGQGTIQGRYGYYGQGDIVPNDFGVPPGPWLSFGTATFDGVGSFRWTSSDFPGVQLTGTYVLRRDCTGAITFNFPAPLPPAAASIIAVDRGNEMYIAAPPAGNVFVAVFIYKRQ